MPIVVITIVVAWLMFVTPATAQQPTSDASEPGRQIFFAQGCYGCHRLGAAGTPIAYDLSHVGSKYTEAQLEKWLRDPTSEKARVDRCWPAPMALRTSSGPCCSMTIVAA